MPLLASLRDFLKEDPIQGIDAGSIEFSLAHREVLLHKRLLQQVFRYFYEQCMTADGRYFGTTPGKRLEIGSGAGILKEFYPEVLTSDVRPLPFSDLALDAEQLPFADGSLRAIFAINTFHHLAQPRQFFREALRVLYPGGGVVMIEPYYGPAARALFKNLHSTEGYETDAPSWEMETADSFKGANQALSYVVFKRDFAVYQREFPTLALMEDRPHTVLSYLISGGVNFRQLVPNLLTPAVWAAETASSPLARWLGLQHTIVLRKSAVRG